MRRQSPHKDSRSRSTHNNSTNNPNTNTKRRISISTRNRHHPIRTVLDRCLNKKRTSQSPRWATSSNFTDRDSAKSTREPRSISVIPRVADRRFNLETNTHKHLRKEEREESGPAIKSATNSRLLSKETWTNVSSIPHSATNMRTVTSFPRGQERVRRKSNISPNTVASLVLSNPTLTKASQANLWPSIKGLLSMGTKFKTTWSSAKKCHPVKIADQPLKKAQSKSQTLQVGSPPFSCSDCIE